MNLLSIILLIFFIIHPLYCLNQMNFGQRKFLNKFNTEIIEDDKKKHSYTEEYLEVPIDHFSYIETRTFKLRYLVNTQYVKTNDAPIFFCVGEEGGAEYDASQLVCFLITLI
uniref:Uncharacterized protein n=1 Tax=Meloidogyne enterolobii TaxID=390850 RepID=A0A6V7X8W8_MELEN|nr:unnamed protein product [Meloidogyne enterolobii]